MDETCLHCGEPVRRINYALGERWMHVDRYAGFPDQHKGTAWLHCKLTQVATPSGGGDG